MLSHCGNYSKCSVTEEYKAAVCIEVFETHARPYRFNGNAIVTCGDRFESATDAYFQQEELHLRCGKLKRLATLSGEKQSRPWQRHAVVFDAGYDAGHRANPFNPGCLHVYANIIMGHQGLASDEGGLT